MTSALLIACVTFAAVVVVVVTAFLSLIRGLVRQHARERDLLTNQLLHAVGKDWQPAPADTPVVREEREPQVLRFTPSPEQLSEVN